jgi:polysaccharide biosynthesis/export protein
VRLGDIVSKFRRPAAWTPPALLAALVVLAGCETPGFLDPGEMMRGGANKARLIVPIVPSLAEGLDEIDPDFASAEDIRQADLKASQTDYVIGRNDLISVSISEVAGNGVETVKTTRVSESGNISLPLVGTVKAAGLTEAELEKAVANAYRANNIIANAQVSATVLEARQRTFSVLGAVGRPGQFQIVQSDFRMLDAITIAGGVTVQGIEYAYIIRKDTKPEDTTKPSTTDAPKTGDQPRVKPVDPLEGKQGRGAVIERTRIGYVPETGRPVNLMVLADPPAPAPGETPKRIMIDGKWVDLKPAPGTTTNVPAPTDTVPAAPAKVDPPVTPAVPPADPNVVTPPLVNPVGGGTGTSGRSAAFEFDAPKADADSRIIRVPVERLLKGEIQYNIVIRANDTIIVPEPKVGEYYMGGHVQRTGVYSLTGRQITLKQAIISAGMVDPLAWPERTEIVRRLGKDKELFVRVNLPKIFAGEQPDIFLRPYDTVNVGTNAIAPFLAAIRGSFRFTYGFGFIYDRNFGQENGQQGGF